LNEEVIRELLGFETLDVARLFISNCYINVWLFVVYFITTSFSSSLCPFYFVIGKKIKY